MMITRYITFPDKVRTPRPMPIMLAMMITRLLNKMLKFSEVILALKTLRLSFLGHESNLSKFIPRYTEKRYKNIVFNSKITFPTRIQIQYIYAPKERLILEVIINMKKKQSIK